MSKKKEKKSEKRPYTMKARARRHDDVHRRITKAAVYLHGTVGPARTTMKEIADRAGVRRATVYNHFPTDSELFEACSSDWFRENPPPDSSPWRQIQPPRIRLERALSQMYRYYDSGQNMLSNVMRDAPLVPAMDAVLQSKWLPMIDGMVEILAEGWGPAENNIYTKVSQVREPIVERSSYLQELRASLKVALDFFTWQSLHTSGLTNDRASQLMVSWIVALAKIPE